MNVDIKSWYTFILLITAGILPLYIIRFSLLGIPTNVFEVVVLLAICIGACSTDMRSSWAHTIKTMPRGVQVAVVLFFLSACVSTVISHEIRVSIGILKGWFVVSMVFSFLLASSIKNNPSIKSRAVDSLILSGVAVSVIGLLQIGLMPRITSLYDVPNSLALFVAPILIIALYTGVQLKKRIYIISACIMFIAVLATQSFGAIFAIIGTVIIGARYFSPLDKGEREGVYAERSRSAVRDIATPPLASARRLPSYEGRKFAYFFFFLFLTLSIFLLSHKFQYLISPLIHPGATNSATVRLQLWDIGIRLIKQHPILGIGLGQFEPAYQSELHRLFAEQSSNNLLLTTYNLQPEFIFRDPHNWIISFWLNLGLMGLLSFIYLNYFAIRCAFSPPSVPREALAKWGSGGCDIESAASALALISVLLFGLVDTIYWKNDLSALWWMFAALLI